MKKIYLLLILTILINFTNIFAQKIYDNPNNHKKKKHDSGINSTQVDFFLTLSDGVHLDCTKFIPSGSPPSGGWPCIIICHGYGQTKFDDIDEAQGFADDDNFYSLVYS